MKTFDDYGIDLRGRTGVEIKTTCPECSHTRKKKNYPCLNVNVDKGVWHCWHCEWSGSLSKGEERRPVVYSRPNVYKRPEYRKDMSLLPETVLEWFEARGISEDTLDRAKVGSGKVYMPQIEEEVEAVQFPYYRKGGCVNIKYRQLGEKNFRMHGGAERILYGLDDINDEAIIVVEGEIDKLSCAEVGLWSCLSVPDGAPAPNTKDYASKFSYLDSAADQLAKVKKFVLAVDNDPPGKRLEEELARRLGSERCYRVTWPEGCKDANDALVKHGKEALRIAIETAKPYPIVGAIEVQDVAGDVLDLYANGWPGGVTTGWTALDRLYTVRAGELSVITGIPNSGKSNFLDALAVNLAATHGWRFAVFSPENLPIADHIARLAEKYHTKPFGQGPWPRMTQAELDEALEWIGSHFFWVLGDDDAEWTLDKILSTAKSLILRKGINGLIIDPWNELEHQRPAGLTETEYVSHALKRIRTFARLNRVHVWMVAHPAKMYRADDGKYPIPSMYDISGSAHWRNKADNGICVWRNLGDPDDQTVHIYVQKVRFRQVGRIGEAILLYDKATATYDEQHKVRGIGSSA